jgi:hypothetical protein
VKTIIVGISAAFAVPTIVGAADARTKKDSPNYGFCKDGKKVANYPRDCGGSS